MGKKTQTHLGLQTFEWVTGRASSEQLDELDGLIESVLDRRRN